MTTSDSSHKQFVDFIILQVYDDQYLDRQEEKKILEEGVKRGFSVAEGLAIINQVALEKGFVVEREIEDRVKQLLVQFTANDGKIDKKEFEDALAIFKTACHGKLPEPELKRRLKKIIQDQGSLPLS